MPLKQAEMLNKLFYEKKFGTPKRPPGYDANPWAFWSKTVQNVVDTMPLLIESINDDFARNEEFYKIYESSGRMNVMYNSIGTIDVYERNKPMVFTPA
jgi:hypothetical protein